MFKKMSMLAAFISLSSPLAYAQTITGKVIDQQGEPISGAEVTFVGQMDSVKTNVDGRFTLDTQTDKPTELHVEAKGFSHASINTSSYGVAPAEEQAKTEEPLLIALHKTVMEVIDVKATPLHSSSIESALPITVITADNLRMKQSSTLGDTLKNEVGIHSTYYGPVASSPIIRGLDGPRVLITQNGLDVGDASRVGPDHIVSTETSTAESIEVLRGPSTLFYGSGAIGGVVNIVDKRIPQDNENRVDYMVKHNTVSDENEASLSVNTGVDNFAFYADGFTRESNDYDIPGYASTDPDEHENEGKLANSAADSSGFTLGTSYLLDNGFVGVSFESLDREYGIPGHEHHHDDHDEDEHGDHEEDEHDEESVYGDLEQKRYQMISELNFSDQWINRINTKLAYTDYEHKEIEGGEVGTTFSNEMKEARFDFYHQAVNGWQGAFTLHYKFSDFDAIGEEAFTPPSETESIALAWIEEKHVGNVLWQIGARIEQVDIDVNETHEHDDHDEDEHDDHEEFDVASQDFTPFSVSVGAVWDYQPGYNLGFNVAMSQRAPASSELFSNGEHIGTNTYELGAVYEIEQEGDEVEIHLGDQDIDVETLYSFDLTWRKFEGDVGFIASVFYNRIQDYFYQENSGFTTEDLEHDHDEHEGEEESGLPIYIYVQDDVNLWGVEAEVVAALTPNLKGTIFSDYISAELTSGENLPRIPPLRLGTTFNYEQPKYSAELSIAHTFSQHDYAEGETSTDGYTLIDANFNYYVDNIGSDFVVFVKAENLLDEEARVHTSFLKDDVTLPGRGFSLGVRGSF